MIKSLLEDRAIDLLVAEHVLGWVRSNYAGHSGQFQLWIHPKEGPGGIFEERIPKYSTEIKATYELEDAIWAKEKWRDYAHALMTVIGAMVVKQTELDLFPSNYAEEMSCHPWDLLHASPRNRCLAALKTFGADIKETK